MDAPVVPEVSVRQIHDIAREAVFHLAEDGVLRAGRGVATNRLSSATPLKLVDAIVSGVHAAGESHYELLRAFVACHRGDANEAERLYRIIVTQYPDDAEAWYQLCETRDKAGTPPTVACARSGNCVAEWLPQMIAPRISVTCVPVLAASCALARL